MVNNFKIYSMEQKLITYKISISDISSSISDFDHIIHEKTPSGYKAVNISTASDLQRNLLFVTVLFEKI